MNARLEYPPSDEIDVRDLLVALIRGWKWVVGGVVASLVLAILYLAIAPENYETALRFSGSPDGLQALNSMPNTSYSSNEVKQELLSKLGSYENFNRFIIENEDERQNLRVAFSDLGSSEDFESKARRFFFDNVSVSEPSPDSESITASITIVYKNGLDGAGFLNSYYRWTEAELISDLVGRTERSMSNTISQNERRMEAQLKIHEEEIANRIDKLQEQDEIRHLQLKDSLRAEQTSERDARRERIRSLMQAEQIAANLGIKEPTTPRDLGRQSGEREVVYAEINSQGGLPLYFMDTKALAAERVVIEKNLEDNVKKQRHQKYRKTTSKAGKQSRD